MAKKRTIEGGQNIPDVNIPGQEVPKVAGRDKDLKAEDQPLTEIPSQVDEVLKSFRSYETLYVDAQGGFFSPDTPKPIRGTAILYKNPYYKS